MRDDLYRHPQILGVLNHRKASIFVLEIFAVVKHRIFTLQICKFASNLSIMCCKPSCRMTGVSHPENAFLHELTGVTKAGVDVQKMEQASSSVSLTDGLIWVPNIGVWKKKAITTSVLAFLLAHLTSTICMDNCGLMALIPQGLGCPS